MLTIAVGLVDKPANERPFLMMKKEETMPPSEIKKDETAGGSAAPAAATTAGLKMPAAAKQAFTDGIAAALEQLAGIAQIVQSAEVDETAPPPTQLAGSVDETADMLDEIADQFMPEENVAESYDAAKKPPAPPPGDPAVAAPPPPVEKTDVQKAAHAKAEKRAIRKAARRMSKGRVATLQSAHAMQGQAHELVGNLIKDIVGGNEMMAAPPPEEKAAAAPPPPPPPVEKVDDAAIAKACTDAVQSEIAKALPDAIAKAVASALPSALTSALTPIVKALEGQAVTEAVHKAATVESGIPRAGSAEGSGGSGSAPKPVTWENDLSVGAVARKAAMDAAKR